MIFLIKAWRPNDQFSPIKIHKVNLIKVNTPKMITKVNVNDPRVGILEATLSEVIFLEWANILWERLMEVFLTNYELLHHFQNDDSWAGAEVSKFTPQNKRICKSITLSQLSQDKVSSKYLPINQKAMSNRSEQLRILSVRIWGSTQTDTHKRNFKLSRAHAKNTNNVVSKFRKDISSRKGYITIIV